MKKFLIVVVVFFSCLSQVQAQGWQAYIPAGQNDLQNIIFVDKEMFVFGDLFASKTPFSSQWTLLPAYGDISHSAYLNGCLMVAGTNGLLNVSQGANLGVNWQSLYNLSWSTDIVDIIIDNDYFIVLPYQYECATLFNPVSGDMDSLYLIPDYYVQQGFVVGNRIFIVYGDEYMNNVLCFTEDFGQSWFAVEFDYPGQVVSVEARSTRVALAIVDGNDSKILFSDDGAMSWQVHQEFLGQELVSVCLTNEDICAAGNEGDDGFIYEYGEIKYMSPGLNLNFMIFSEHGNYGNYDLAAVGDGGIILVRNCMVSVTDFSADASQVGFEAYPNPCVNYFTVDFGQDLLQPSSVCVYDLTGRVIYNQRVVDNFKVDLSGQPKGMYFIKIGNVTKKIMKQ